MIPLKNLIDLQFQVFDLKFSSVHEPASPCSSLFLICFVIIELTMMFATIYLNFVRYRSRRSRSISRSPINYRRRGRGSYSRSPVRSRTPDRYRSRGSLRDGGREEKRRSMTKSRSPSRSPSRSRSKSSHRSRSSSPDIRSPNRAASKDKSRSPSTSSGGKKGLVSYGDGTPDSAGEK